MEDLSREEYAAAPELEKFLATTADEMLGLLSHDDRGLYSAESIFLWIMAACNDRAIALDPVSLTEVLISLESYARDRLRAQRNTRSLTGASAVHARAAQLREDPVGAILVLRTLLHVRAIVLEAYPLDGAEIIAAASRLDANEITRLARIILESDGESQPPRTRTH